MFKISMTLLSFLVLTACTYNAPTDEDIRRNIVELNANYATANMSQADQAKYYSEHGIRPSRLDNQKFENTNKYNSDKKSMFKIDLKNLDP